MNEAADKDLPLREDIRLLGRLLGDTVREQNGEAIFERIERIRNGYSSPYVWKKFATYQAAAELIDR